MERQDGKNPFDPSTYTKPALTIETMLELRAFCASFFDAHVRRTADAKNTVHEEAIESFLALIIHSPQFFARARAVIPEFQVPSDFVVEESSSSSSASSWSDGVKVLVEATKGWRGPKGKTWESLPEEPAWEKLAMEGRENLERGIRDQGVGRKMLFGDDDPCGSPSK